jgi:hypothetical protein
MKMRVKVLCRNCGKEDDVNLDKKDMLTKEYFCCKSCEDAFNKSNFKDIKEIINKKPVKVKFKK